MTQRDKLLEKLESSGSDKNWTIAELSKALALKGYSLRNVSGSHYVFIGHGTTFAVPVHGRSIKPVYVKKAREL